MERYNETLDELREELDGYLTTLHTYVANNAFKESRKLAKRIANLLEWMQEKKEWGEEQRKDRQRYDPSTPEHSYHDAVMDVRGDNGKMYDSNMLDGDAFGDHPMDGPGCSWEDAH